MFFTAVPPAMFEVTEVTQTNLSFSWSPPIITGPIINYTLSCTTTVPGIGQPSPLQTAEQTATLDTLDPGVPYVCSVSARTGTETSLEAVIAATTLESGRYSHTWLNCNVCILYLSHVFDQLLLVCH